ncbi:LOW QUALITY PROTEIN: liver carboxylesterase 1-like [Ctenodactylus gundi]
MRRSVGKGTLRIANKWEREIERSGHPTSPPVVDTVHGKVLGKYVSLEGFAQPVAVFLGPFAKPPLGSLRFAPPKPAEPWDYVKNTTSYPPMCSQNPETGKLLSDTFTNRKENISLKFSEDCLYLNIYTPADLTKPHSLPVMVWIHGGGLKIGVASTYDGVPLSAHGNVVVVTIQYRLDIWGFFSTGDEHSRGNWGHLDQVAALQWVQDNIANFRGNPDSVTIFGESAGGKSVSVLVLSPLAKNLFHRAISQSGVDLTPGLLEKNVKPIAEEIAVNAGCETTTSAAMVHCLCQKTEDELLEVAIKLNLFTLPALGPSIIPTVIDGVLLLNSPEEILAEKNFSTVPYIVGINEQEFAWFIPVCELCVTHVFSDAGGPTYMYEFQYRPSFSSPMKPKAVVGDHGYEIVSVFGALFLKARAHWPLSPSPSTMWLCALVLVSVSAGTAWEHPPSPPVVNTAHGKVLGKYVSLKGFAQPAAVFLGVPFAKPPLGSLRFTPPQPPEPWHYVKNTTSYPPMCSQDAQGSQSLSDLFTNRKERISFNYSEDCLYLNIYTPADLKKKSSLPVMVWVHGGGLVVGGASTYDGLALSAHENVVVVTIQYRLGIWGFFSTGDEHSRGNWGHLDQVAALQWVQDNIANFGGNPGSVTIFGESAGGESVSVLVLSPLAKNLFHRAISESGVVFTAGLFTKNVKPVAKKIAVSAGCPTTTSAVMVHCLRQKTEEQLLETSFHMMKAKVMSPWRTSKQQGEEEGRRQQQMSSPDLAMLPLGARASPSSLVPAPPWPSPSPRTHVQQDLRNAEQCGNLLIHLLPLSSQKLLKIDFSADPTERYPIVPTVVDGVFLPKTPEELYAEKSVNTVPYMVGINKQEFSWIIPMMIGNQFSEDKMDDQTATSLLWKFYPLVSIPQELTPMAIEKHLGGTNDLVKKKNLFLDMIGDLMFGVPSVIVSRSHRDAGGPTYMYEFQYRPSFSSPMKPKTVVGDHGDEIFSVLGAPFLKDGASEEEINLSKTVMKFWANFARNGNPNGQGLPHWPAYDQKEGYLQIGATIQAAQGLKAKEVAFWTELLAKDAAKKSPQGDRTEL